MKKSILAVTLAGLTTMAVMGPLAQEVQAQTIGTLRIKKDTDGTAALEWLAKRIYSIEAGTLAYEMDKDGVTERSFVAVFSIKGALVQNYELSGNREGLEKIGREPGFQILPYTISLTSDGRKFISVAAIALKDMNKAYNTVGSNQGGMVRDDFWTIANNLEFIVYEYDENFSNQNMTTQKLDLVRAEFKVDILGSSKPGRFLAIVAGGSAGFRGGKIQQGTKELYLNGWDGTSTLSPIRTGIDYQVGMEFQERLSPRSTLNVGASLRGGSHNGHNLTSYQYGYQMGLAGDAIDKWKEEKGQYEADHLNGKKISDSSYETLTGNKKPEGFDNDKYAANRNFLFFTPSIKFDTRLSSKTTLEINVFGNIPVKDNYRAQDPVIDLRGTNARPVVGGGVRLRF